MPPLRNRLATRRLIGAALLAMVLGQWALLAHSIGHARALEPVAQAVGGEHGHDHGWGHQAGTSACELLDHLLGGQAPGSGPMAADGRTPAAPQRAAGAAAEAPGPVARAFEARGPPRA